MKRTLAKQLLIGIVVFEAFLPVALMATFDHQRHFVWGMYSTASTKYRYVGVTRDSYQAVLGPAEVGSPWGAIHYGRRTLRLLCEGHAEVESVTRYYDKRLERTERC